MGSSFLESAGDEQAEYRLRMDGDVLVEQSFEVGEAGKDLFIEIRGWTSHALSSRS